MDEADETNNSRSVTVTAVVPPRGELSTDKSAYLPGETVTIVFRNTGSVPIELPNSAPWEILDAWGRVVYRPMAAMVITPVQPGTSKVWTWNQRDSYGNPVPPGDYTVRLGTRNAGEFTADFSIRAPSLRAEAGGPYSGIVGVPITFDGRGSTGDIVEYRWDFGDGSFGTGAVVQHAYSSPGTYTVRLTVRDRYGMTDTDTARVTVSAPAKPDLVIESITYEPATPRVGDTLTFRVRVRNVGGARAGRFYVRIHDGAGYQQGSLSGLNPSQAYTLTLRLRLTRSPETFTAVVDYYNRVDELDETNNTRSVTVTAVAVNQPPEARFTFSPTSPKAGDTVRFDASASRDPDGSIVQYLWEFGDGATGTGRTVTHAYASPGTYTVRLTVRDDKGATDATTATINVGAAPGPGPTPGTLPGMPKLDKPGIYVWGDPQDHWHITVYASPDWPNARKFQVQIKATARLQLLSVSSGAPRASAAATQIAWSGTIPPGTWYDLSFDIHGTYMELTLYLDTDGDGIPQPRRRADRKKIVYIRRCKTNPPMNPFVIIAPRGMDVVLPSQNFYIGYCISGTFPRCAVVKWLIESREEEAGCR